MKRVERQDDQAPRPHEPDRTALDSGECDRAEASLEAHLFHCDRCLATVQFFEGLGDHETEAERRLVDAVARRAAVEAIRLSRRAISARRGS